MKATHVLTALGLAAAAALAGPAAQAADAAAGKKLFARCKSCHMIANGDDVIFKGGKTGPNLYGIVGRPVGAEEGFRYGKGFEEAREAGLVWTEEDVAAYITDPTAWIREKTGDPRARSNMSFKLRRGADDVAAYLASVAE
ncbi:cytochrome c [Albimonas donghaensis]|uniref:Cytochrome c n=1 Tax=Albimonas donghaensis TaxID=356660 RepID=A0A1H2RKE8_9RHOB|nr:c-type cytochrome [Albimonas donghaensis]SDW19119.1 cytochrome c [Albimonas donghaensis]